MLKPVTPYAGITDVEFATSDDRIASLQRLQLGKTSDAFVIFDGRRGEWPSWSALVGALKTLEDEYSEAVDANVWNLPIYARSPDDDLATHRLNWLGVGEGYSRSVREESRSNHNWWMTLGAAGIELQFEHGKWGYRRERFDRWSNAFDRLSGLLSKQCDWHSFGDVESRNALIGKGQFFWQPPDASELRPVDNFVFVADDGFEVTQAGAMGRCVLTHGDRPADVRFEWVGDHAEGLRRLAARLRVSDRLAAQEAPEVLAGKFVVKSIFKQHDVLDAPILVFKTHEGARVSLDTSRSAWALHNDNGNGQVRSRMFEEDPAAALEVMADLLKGTTSWEEFSASVP